MRRHYRLCLLLAGLALALAGRGAQAQGGGGGGGGGTTTVPPATISNSYLTLVVFGDGSIGMVSSANNPTDAPGGQSILYGTDPFDPSKILGSRIYIRVDGGASNFQNSAMPGWDDIFGGPSFLGTGTGGGGNGGGGNGGGGNGGGGNGGGGNGGGNTTGGFGGGAWKLPPTAIGNSIQAQWLTDPVIRSTANGLVVTDIIEVDLTATLVHSSVRFQFNIQNLDTGNAHTVGLAFVQDIAPFPNTTSQINQLGGPIRIPGQPYLHHETVLVGSQIPQYWQTYDVIAPASQQSSNGTTKIIPAQIHSIQGTLKPPASSETDPTIPSRVEYGTTSDVTGFSTNCTLQNTLTTFPFDCLWLGFTPNPSIVLDQSISSGGVEPDVAIGLFWDAQIVPPTSSKKIVTYLGQGDSSNDFAPPMALSVSGPIALNYANSKTPQLWPIPFSITAYVDNLLDLVSANGTATDIGPVNLFLNLPKGLALASGDVPNKQITSVPPETESSVSWSVQADGTATGLLTYSVAATPNIGAGKVVQRTIEVPAPAQVTLIGNAINQGQFQMLSFPLVFGTTPPIQALFPNLPPSSSTPIDIVRWDPATSSYKPVTQLVPGLGYWVRNDQANTVTVALNTSLYPPLQNQVQPSSAPYKISYPLGWNQIGDPYLYGIPFSEIQVYDPQTLQLATMSEAVDVAHQWVMPAVYEFDTSDPNPKNWGYVLLDNIGFIMQPYQGYWILVKKAGLQFIYPGVDTPGVSVTRAAQLGVGLGSQSGRATTNNWRLQLSARDADTSDLVNYIGVSPHATDGPDVFKYDKPPLISHHVALDIVHSDWQFGGRFLQDLRSPAMTRKTWDLVVHSTKPNEEVTISWPGYAASVPRNYQVMLLDPASQTQRQMRTNASYTVKTGADGLAKLQIVALPMHSSGQVLITGFDIVPNGRAVGGPRSVSINYTLSQPAETQIVVRDRTGRAIRTLPVSTRAATGSGAPNTGSAVWDLRDDRGVSIAPGVYNLELNVVDADGQRSRQIRPYLLTR